MLVRFTALRELVMDPLKVEEEEAVVARAKDTVHQLYQLFKTHPHNEQWTKEAKPLSRVSWKSSQVAIE